MNPIRFFCYHESIQNIVEISVFKPDGSETRLDSAERLKSEYGIWIEGEQTMTTKLSIDSDDATLYDFYFELTIKSMVI